MTAPAARTLPAPETLTWDQSAGRACVWCRAPLAAGAVHAGTICDRDNAHVLNTEVWSCPRCDAGEAARPRPRRQGTNTPAAAEAARNGAK